MKEKYIIELELCDDNRNFGEILEQIKEFLEERDGVEGTPIIYRRVD